MKLAGRGHTLEQSALDDVTEHLLQVEFPASRQELVEAVRGAGAPPALISRIEALGRDRYDDIESVRRDLVARRAESNPALVAITAEVCEECGFPRAPGEPHSCVEEKARFAESVRSVTDEFARIDDASDQARSAGH